MDRNVISMVANERPRVDNVATIGCFDMRHDPGDLPKATLAIHPLECMLDRLVGNASARIADSQNVDHGKAPNKRHSIRHSSGFTRRHTKPSG